MAKTNKIIESEVEEPSVALSLLTEEDDDTSIVRTLLNLEDRGVVIIWEKDRSLDTFVIPNIQSAFANSLRPEPVMPTDLTLYTNNTTEELKCRLNECIEQILMYDRYQDKLKDDPEVLGIMERYLKNKKKS